MVVADDEEKEKICAADATSKVSRQYQPLIETL